MSEDEGAPRCTSRSLHNSSRSGRGVMWDPQAGEGDAKQAEDTTLHMYRVCLFGHNEWGKLKDDRLYRCLSGTSLQGKQERHMGGISLIIDGRTCLPSSYNYLVVWDA